LLRALIFSCATGSIRPWLATKRADSGPPKPVVALLAMRATLKSVALIHSRAFQRSVS